MSRAAVLQITLSNSLPLPLVTSALRAARCQSEAERAPTPDANTRLLPIHGGVLVADDTPWVSLVPQIQASDVAMEGQTGYSQGGCGTGQ